MKLQKSLLAILITSTLTACGGSGGSSSTETQTLSGKVADGYLVNATVCLDLNNNKICDNNEPQAASTAGGAFSLENVTQKQIDSSPLLVQIIENETIDEDAPDTVLTKPYTLSAPSGFTFVSPLTTMVQNEIEKGSSATAAEALIKEKLGTTLDLASDYVAGESDSAANQAEFKKLHQIAQVTAHVMAANMEQLQETATTENIETDKLVSLIIENVIESLNDITSHIENTEVTADKPFSPDAIADNIQVINKETLKDQIAENEAKNNSVSSNLLTILQADGLSWFSAETNNNEVFLEHGTLTMNADGSVQEPNYSWKNGQWLINEDEDNGLYVLTANGWTLENDSITSITLNDDQSITLHRSENELNETVAGTQFSLEGLNIALMMRNTEDDGTWDKYLPADAVFPANSIGYKLNFHQQNEVSYSFYGGSDCGDYAVNGICNAIYLNGRAATTLDELVVDTAASLTDTTAQIKGIYLNWNNSDENLIAELVADKSINFYLQNNSSQMLKQIATGSWADKTVNGQKLRVIAELSAAQGYKNVFDNIKENTILFEYKGAVRIGEQQKAGDKQRDEVAFNPTARDAILDSFNVNTEAATDFPSTFTQEWVSGKTLYSVWYGDGEAESNAAMPIVVQLDFKSNGEMTGKGLLNEEIPEGKVLHYKVSESGLLYIVEDQKESISEGNRIVCGGTSDYIKTHYVFVDSNGNEKFDNVDLYFLDKEKALAYAKTLNDYIPQATCSL